MRKPSARERVGRRAVELLADRGPMPLAAIEQELRRRLRIEENCLWGGLSGILSELAREGVIERPERGVYGPRKGVVV